MTTQLDLTDQISAALQDAADDANQEAMDRMAELFLAVWLSKSGLPEAADTATQCACGGWCECHKPGWPEGETCDCARLMTPTARPLPQGAHVRFYDGHVYRYGSVVAYTRSAHFEWKVYVVRATNGIGNSCSGPNGEVFSVVEVHPDRIREVIDPDEV